MIKTVSSTLLHNHAIDDWLSEPREQATADQSNGTTHESTTHEARKIETVRGWNYELRLDAKHHPHVCSAVACVWSRSAHGWDRRQIDAIEAGVVVYYQPGCAWSGSWYVALYGVRSAYFVPYIYYIKTTKIGSMLWELDVRVRLLRPED